MSALKIAIVGSAPSSCRLAPYGDPSWKIFGCSPGLYPVAPRINWWIEIHRWEPGVIGKPDTQKAWFSPEYILWMSQLPMVFMKEKVPQIPNSVALDVEGLTARYGNIWFTSSIAWMMAMSIEEILDQRMLRSQGKEPALAEGEEDAIGLWGVDMAATEEWKWQRPGCQRFIELCHNLGIKVVVPPESDLLRPMPLYGIMESDHWHIKGLVRKNELQQRLGGVQMNKLNLEREEAFLRGALDNHDYHMDTWCQDRPMFMVSHEVLAESPVIKSHLAANTAADFVPECTSTHLEAGGEDTCAGAAGPYPGGELMALTPSTEQFAKIEGSTGYRGGSLTKLG